MRHWAVAQSELLSYELLEILLTQSPRQLGLARAQAQRQEARQEHLVRLAAHGVLVDQSTDDGYEVCTL